jgi:hypothetical protein
LGSVNNPLVVSEHLNPLGWASNPLVVSEHIKMSADINLVEWAKLLVV